LKGIRTYSVGASVNLKDEYCNESTYRQIADYLKKGPPAAFLDDSNMFGTKIFGHATVKQHMAEVTDYSHEETRQHATRSWVRYKLQKHEPYRHT
jgi:hypothetical protein